MQIEFDGTFSGWRSSARSLLAEGVRPESVTWLDGGGGRTALDGLVPSATNGGLEWKAGETRVPRRFLQLAELVACHRDPGRWEALYRALRRLVSGEPHLLALVTDPDVLPLVRAQPPRGRAHRSVLHPPISFDVLVHPHP